LPHQSAPPLIVIQAAGEAVHKETRCHCHHTLVGFRSRNFRILEIGIKKFLSCTPYALDALLRADFPELSGFLEDL
jgi:hypothetical protein